MFVSSVVALCILDPEVVWVFSCFAVRSSLLGPQKYVLLNIILNALLP